MILKNSAPRLNLFVPASLLLVASVAVVAMTLASGTAAATVNAQPGESLALDAGAFGSSAGQASIKAAPTIWSSRSTVRWNARWASDGRYLV